MPLVAVSVSAGAAITQPEGFAEMARRCAPGVSESTMGQIVSHESNANPYAIGLNSKTERLPRSPRNVVEAVATAEWLYARSYNFDSGLGQINSQHIAKLGLRFADLFDPCENLRVAGSILSDCYSRAVEGGYRTGQPALKAALSCYNTGSFTAGIDNGYVTRVAAAPPATLAVPALESSQGEVSAPIKLKALPAQAPLPVSDPDPEGSPDVFDGQPGDAFRAPPKNQAVPVKGDENSEY